MIVQYVGAVIDIHKGGDLISEGKEERESVKLPKVISILVF